MSAGNVHNRIPEKAEARINIRVVKLDDIKSIFDFVKKTSGLEVTVVKTSDLFETAPESKEMKKVLSAYNRAFGRNTKPQRMCGATDARHTCKMGCPTFITGLDGYNSHGRDEYIELGSIDKLVTMIIDVI